MNISATAQATGIGEQMPWELRPRNVRIIGPPTNVEMKVKMSAQISFGEFNKRNDEPIIPMLQNLLRFATNSVESFADEFV